MAKVNRYVSIVKAKAGETAGLEKLSVSVLGAVTPFFEMPDYLPIKFNSVGKPRTFDERFQVSCENIIACWQDKDAAFLDLDFGDDRRFANGDHPLEYALSQLTSNGVEVIPVLNLERDSAYVSLGLKGAQANSGILGLRLFYSDLIDKKSTIEKITALLLKRKIDPSGMILLLDFGSLRGTAQSEVMSVSTAWSSEPYLAKFGGVVFAGSNLPRAQDIRKGLDRVPRIELSVWTSVFATKNIGYADYGITHPQFVDLDMRGAAKIRYATPADWILLKGTQLSKTDPLQYQKLCRELVKCSGYRANDLNFGNQFIRRCLTATDKLGSLEKWVAVDTNVHVSLTASLVVERATKLGLAPELVTS